VNGLAERRYQALPDLVSPDFVLLFVPIESAFVAAVNADRELGMWALKQNVLLVCPTTLLATIRLVAQIWSYERQNRNAKEIARLCGQMYDKLVGFVTDLEEVGKRLAHAQRSYDEAYSKLHTGRGSVIRTAERVRELGVKPQKTLPAPLIEAAEDDLAPPALPQPDTRPGAQS
jgi:DNA recombination protein RmuC